MAKLTGSRKVKECSHCGCPRVLLVKASITKQSPDGSISYSLKQLCFPCLLAFPKLIDNGLPKGHYDKSAAYACVDGASS